MNLCVDMKNGWTFGCFLLHCPQPWMTLFANVQGVFVKRMNVWEK